MKSTNILNILLFIASSSIAIVLAQPNGAKSAAKPFQRTGSMTELKSFLTKQKHQEFRTFLDKHSSMLKDATFSFNGKKHPYKGNQYKIKLDNGKIKYNAKTGEILHYITAPTSGKGTTTTTIKDGKGNLVRSYETLGEGVRQHYNAKGEKTFTTTKGQAENGFTTITKTTGTGEHAKTETLFMKDANKNRFKVNENGKLPEIRQIEKAAETLDAQGGKYKGMGRKILKGLGYGVGAVIVLALLNALITKSHEKEEPAASSISGPSSSSSSPAVTDPLISTSPFSPPVPASLLPPMIPSSAGSPSMSGFSGMPAVAAF